MKSNNSNSQTENNFKINVNKNGPYLASGAIPLAEQKIRVDADDQCHGWEEGKKYPAQKSYALCRCGHSKNKPFCDGTHMKVHFEGTETASRESYAEQAGEVRGPGLVLTDAEDLCALARCCHRVGGTWQLTQQSGDPVPITAVVFYFAQAIPFLFEGIQGNALRLNHVFQPDTGIFFCIYRKAW
jgi:CDGSH-type Zn-finger protein